MARPPFVIGLTGGIGSGKSSVASLFSELGARVIDADAIVHRLLDRPAVRRALVRAFGPEVVRGGRIDRPAVARAAFRNGRSVRRLNRIVHPHVRREIVRRLRAPGRKGRPAVLDAAMLLEAGAGDLCDVLIHVDAPRAVREKRVRSRGWDAGELRRREAHQWSAARKRARADYIVRNGGSRAALRRQVERVMREISGLYQEEA